jgi:hypothetical protein
VSLVVAGLGLAGRVSVGRFVLVVTLDMCGSFVGCLQADLSGSGRKADADPAPPR